MQHSPGGQSLFSWHARLYLQLARLQRYQYREALTDLDPFANDEHRPAYIRYMSYWTIANILNRNADRDGSRVAVENALRVARDAEKRGKRSLRRDIADMTNLLGEIHLSAGDLAARVQVRSAISQSAIR